MLLSFMPFMVSLKENLPFTAKWNMLSSFIYLEKIIWYLIVNAFLRFQCIQNILLIWTNFIVIIIVMYMLFTPVHLCILSTFNKEYLKGIFSFTCIFCKSGCTFLWWILILIMKSLLFNPLVILPPPPSFLSDLCIPLIILLWRYVLHVFQKY